MSQGGKRTVFLVNTVTLAHQQRDAIEKATNLTAAVYTGAFFYAKTLSFILLHNMSVLIYNLLGDMNVDNWRHDRWYNEFDKNQVKKKLFLIFLLFDNSYWFRHTGTCRNMPNCRGCYKPWLH